MLEKTLQSPLDCKEIKPVNPKRNQSWIFIVRTDAEAETPILGPPDAKNWLIRKDPDAGRDWRREEKGMTEDEMIGWHHRLNGHEFEQALGVGDGQGSLACCSAWGRKESDTEWLDWTELALDLELQSWKEWDIFNSSINLMSYSSFLNYQTDSTLSVSTFISVHLWSHVILWGVAIPIMNSLLKTLVGS